MAEKEISPGLKFGLEFGPVVLFFIAYLLMRDTSATIGGREYSGFILVTAGFVPVFLGSIAALWALTGKVSRIQVFTAFMVIFFGGLTIWFNDDRFFKMKTTIVYGCFTLILGAGLLRGRSFLEYLMAEIVPLQPEGWMIFTKRITATFAGLAVANEIVWRNFSNDVWVPVESFGFPIVLAAVIMGQAKLFEQYAISDDDAEV